MNFRVFRSVNYLRCNRWHPGGINSWSLSDWGVAAAGEMGEALNIIKKINRERDNLKGNVDSELELRRRLAEEIADTVIYLDLLSASIGIDLEQAIISKFNRVSNKMGWPDLKL